MSNTNGAAETFVVIGTGEMGVAVARRMRECGARVRTTLRGRSEASVERVRRVGLEVIDDEDTLIDGASFILSIVPPGQASAVAGRFDGALSRARTKPAFVECNAIAPETSREIARTLEHTGCAYIDAGIVGGPPAADSVALEKSPRFYASGPTADSLIRLRDYGIHVIVLDRRIGTASGLKMCYASLTKGLTALGAVSMMAASRENLDEALWNELSRSQPQMLAWLSRQVPTMLPKAYRWVAEMEQIGEFMGGPGKTIYQGASQLYDQLARAQEATSGESEQASQLRRFCARKSDR